MAERKKSRQPKYVEKTQRELIALSRLILILVTSTTNILVAIEELKKYFPRLKLKVVDDDLLPEKVDAHANPKRWIIKIRRSVYNGLLRGSTRGRWTLVHELAHVLLQHPGRPARPIHVVETESTRHGRREREADTVARSTLIPFDRFSDATFEHIRNNSGASTKAVERRMLEFANAKAIRDAVQHHGLDLRLFTSEFDHRRDIERQVAVTAQAFISTLQSDYEEDSILIEPIRNNIFSTAVTVASASGLLFDAYQSLNRNKHKTEFVTAASLAISILTIRPLRPIGSIAPSGAVQANLKCASLAALKTAGMSPTQMYAVPFILSNIDSSPYESVFIKDIRLMGERVITNESTILTLENFPSYDDYNIDHDICWEDVKEIERIAEYLLVLFCSSNK